MNDDDIQTIANFFKGSRRTRFLDSIAVVRESIELGGWVSRGAQRAGKGIKSIATHKHLIDISDRVDYDDPRRKPLSRCYMAVSYGRTLSQEDLQLVTRDDLAELAPKVPVEVTRAWLRLMVSLDSIYTDLNASRPLPVYTEIGLSPRVTATLQDAELDLDLATRRLCPLDSRWLTVFDKNGQVVLRSNGEPMKAKFYFPKWPPGTVFHASRFAHSDCEACGKSIPSGLVVPILVSDKSGRSLGFWFGRDCARNILGIKDAGIPDSRSQPS